MKKTTWFTGDYSPKRNGEYEVKRKGVSSSFPAHTFLHFSTKRGWTHTDHSSCGEFIGDFACMGTKDIWRGLLKEYGKEQAEQIEALRNALVSAVETIECMHGCTSPASDEVERAIQDGRTALKEAGK